jgi:hypothetical protein
MGCRNVQGQVRQLSALGMERTSDLHAVRDDAVMGSVASDRLRQKADGTRRLARSWLGMTVTIASTAARLKKAKHHEIAVRYRNGKKPTSMAPLRCAEIRRLFVSRYGRVLPDDDAGRDDARIMCHHLALMSGDQRLRMKSWLTVWTPWMSADEMASLITNVIAKPIRWRADTMAGRLGLMEADRARLGITTIGAVDVSKAEREAARKARKRQAKREKRRAKGAIARREHLAQSKEQAKPWITEGISRRTWYRRQHQTS